MPDDSVQRVEAVVTGRVQGVGFRRYVARWARRLALTGWVKNLEDGRVELFAQGPEVQLDKLLTWCEHGPVLAKVASVDKQIAELDQQLVGFEVRR